MALPSDTNLVICGYISAALCCYACISSDTDSLMVIEPIVVISEIVWSSNDCS